MDKIKHSNKNTTPFDELNLIDNLLKANKVPELINQISRNYRAEYSYSNILPSLLSEYVSD